MNMRLQENEINAIKDAINQNISSAEIFLFGSRVDDNKRGGDIDLLVIGNDEKKISELIDIKIMIKDKIGEQIIDLFYQTKNNLSNFAKLIKLDAVKL